MPCLSVSGNTLWESSRVHSGFSPSIQSPGWLQQSGMWQRSRWVWDALISRDVLWDAQDQTSSPDSWIFKRKHKLLWLMMKQKLHFAFGKMQNRAAAPSARCLPSSKSQGSFSCCHSRVRARTGFPWHTSQCFAVLFLLLPYRPRRPPGSLGLQIPHIHPQPSLYPREWDNKSPGHLMCCLHRTKHLLSRDKGVARGKLGDAKVSPKCRFAHASSEPWDARGCW